MTKIAFVYLSNYSNWPMGGMLSYVKNLIPYLVNYKDIDMDIWGGAVNKEAPKNINIKGKDIPVYTYTDIKTYNKRIPNFMKSFFDIIKSKNSFKKYDIIYSHTSATTIGLRLVFPFKFIVHHQHGLSYKKVNGYRRILNIGYTLAQLFANMTFFVASEEEVNAHKQSLIIFNKKKFYSIGSPIDYQSIVAQKRCIEIGVLKFIYTGRIDEWKNIDLLISAFNLFYKKYNKPCTLTIVGDGPDLEAIQRKIKALKMERVIIITGRKDHDILINYLKESQIFLFPSKGEGVSLSILEAFSAGLPVVGFNVVGVRNLVKNNYTGILVDNESVEAYVNGIFTILPIYDSLAENCIKTAAKYDSDYIASTICKVIHKEYELYSNNIS